MRLVYTSLSAILALNIPGAAFASDTQSEPKTAVSASAKAGDDAGERKERLICKRELDTTSRIRPPKICRTAAQWRQKQNS